MPKASFVKRIKNRFSGSALSVPFYKFLVVHTEFLIFTGLPGVFINTFLMSQTGDVNGVLYYNCVSFCATALGMLLSSAVLHRLGPGLVSLIGIVGFNLLYLQLILFGSRASEQVVLLGITNGIASAFYWMSYSQLLTEYTDLQNRDKGLAAISISGSTVNLVVPLISGAIISSIGGEKGYNTIFVAAFVVAVITAFGFFSLPKPQHVVTHVRHKETMRHVLHNRCLLFALLSEAFKGLRDGAFGFILSILLYKLVKSEMLIGFNTFLASGASILSFFIMSKVIKTNNRIRYMKIAVLCLIAYSVCTVFTINPIVLIIFTVVNSFFSGFIVNSSFSTFLDAVQVVPGSSEKRPELFAQKELFLSIGRCAGILIMVFVNMLSNNSIMWQAVSLLLLSVSQIGTIAMCKRATHLVHEFSESQLQESKQ